LTAKKPPVTRLRRLSAAQEQRLELIRRVSQLLDSAMVVPGTSFRFGLDPILGLLPGLGDLVSPLFTIGVIWQARDLGIPRVVQLRMIFNVAIDTLLGMVPLAGDLFDFAWKSNIMNLALLERHAYEEHPPSTGDWVFVSVAIALLLALAVTPFLLLGWLMTLVGRLFG
jgi:hypothetical protein